jgi:hypothetical protein
MAEIFSEFEGLFASKLCSYSGVDERKNCVRHGPVGAKLARELGDSVSDQTENDFPVWLFSEITLVLPIR